jgi:hypothetical protein
MVENVGVKIRVVEKSASSAGESEREVATSWLVLIGQLSQQLPQLPVLPRLFAPINPRKITSEQYSATSCSPPLVQSQRKDADRRAQLYATAPTSFNDTQSPIMEALASGEQQKTTRRSANGYVPIGKCICTKCM